MRVKFTEAELAEFTEYTDWHLDTERPFEQSILFKGNVASNVPEFLQDFAAQFSEATVRASQNKKSFIVKVDEFKFRMQLMRKNRYAARLIKSNIQTFEDLNIKNIHQKLLLDEKLKKQGGLIIFCGQPGSGKTSSLVATIQQRLQLYGGFCLTIEDPVEYELFGRHGEGWCDQMDIDEDGYASAIVSSLRCFPSSNQSMLMLGEIRDPVTAIEVLRIAIDGHLVLTTMHSSDIMSALQRLISLAAANPTSNETEVRNLLATSLRLVIHQKLENKHLTMTALRGDPTTTATIANGSISTLKDSIDRFQNKLASGLIE